MLTAANKVVKLAIKFQKHVLKNQSKYSSDIYDPARQKT